MSAKRSAFYAGSFDPMTKGHEQILHQATEIFDEVIVGVGTHPTKRPWMAPAKRIELVTEVCSQFPNVKVIGYTQLTSEMAMELGCTHLVRGVRNESDISAEMQLARLNRSLDGDLETVLLVGAQDLAHISSSFVRELCQHNYDVRSYVPKAVADHI